jgi:hypothetical protein
MFPKVEILRKQANFIRIPFPRKAPVTPPVPPYKHTPLFPLGKDETRYRKISSEGVR